MFSVDNMLWARSKIDCLVGPQEPLLATVKRQKLAWLGLVTCHDSLSKSIPRGTLECRWCCGWQKKCWINSIKEWTSLPMPELPTRASCRKDWKRISAESSLLSHRRPNQSTERTELNWTELIFSNDKGESDYSEMYTQRCCCCCFFGGGLH